MSEVQTKTVKLNMEQMAFYEAGALYGAADAAHRIAEQIRTHLSRRKTRAKNKEADRLIAQLQEAAQKLESTVPDMQSRAMVALDRGLGMAANRPRKKILGFL